MTSIPWSENAVAPITVPMVNSVAGKQVIGVMVRVRVPEDAIPEDIVRDIKHSVEFGEAEVSLAYILAPPLPDPPESGSAPVSGPAD
jgi:hypothetical protein